MGYCIQIERYEDNTYQCYIHKANGKKIIGEAITDGWLPCPSGNFWTIKKIVKEHTNKSINLSQIKWNRNIGEITL